MLLTISQESAVPLVEQIVAAIRGAIASGELKPLDPLPTVRQLAADLGVHMNTVARAYRLLEASGLVRTRRGRGTVVASDAETPRGAKAEIQARLSARIRDALADARLAGFDRQMTQQLISNELQTMWPKE